MPAPFPELTDPQWRALNKLRGTLIDQQIAKEIDSESAALLEALQLIADAHLATKFPRQHETLVNTPTNRGFARFEFTDGNAVSCSLQESSADGAFVWLGCNEIGLKKFTPDIGWKNIDTTSEGHTVSAISPTPGCI